MQMRNSLDCRFKIEQLLIDTTCWPERKVVAKPESP
jgi:hypothetical protein